jgi:hypothetical protein
MQEFKGEFYISSSAIWLPQGNRKSQAGQSQSHLRTMDRGGTPEVNIIDNACKHHMVMSKRISTKCGMGLRYEPSSNSQSCDFLCQLHACRYRYIMLGKLAKMRTHQMCSTLMRARGHDRRPSRSLAIIWHV